MNNRDRKTRLSIFENPVRKSIKWSDVEKLVLALEGTICQGNGSRIRIVVGGVSLNIHTPHPQKKLKPYQVRKLRDNSTMAVSQGRS
ncbi:MAG: hexulose-6-phosphate isomerase [Gammaproteobacteria bacterium]|nr:MAG: hexulose-6-phosphate isomerase [Gammaproteobacteria bacterium]